MGRNMVVEKVNLEVDIIDGKTALWVYHQYEEMLTELNKKSVFPDLEFLLFFIDDAKYTEAAFEFGEKIGKEKLKQISIQYQNLCYMVPHKLEYVNKSLAIDSILRGQFEYLKVIGEDKDVMKAKEQVTISVDEEVLNIIKPTLDEKFVPLSKYFNKLMLNDFKNGQEIWKTIWN